MTKGISILGSTGSIGQAALEVIDGLGESCRVVGLAAGNHWKLLAKQANQHQPQAVALANSSHWDLLRAEINGSVRLVEKEQANEEIASLPAADTVICAIVGAAGLPATVAAARHGKCIALANKEALVAGGSILMPIIEQNGATLLPIDSEHSAIFQAMHSGRQADVRKVYLTASGGPFRTWSRDQMREAGPEDALKHPTWEMGRKITIDSATMMNKALEIIEAHWLFGLDPDTIEVIVHPESIVHSMVEFQDGSIIAQMGSADMRTPIQYALTYPDRKQCCSRNLEVSRMGGLHFEAPDFERFPALGLGYEAARLGGTAGAVLNGANEAAVQEFLQGRIRFTDIVRFSADVLHRHEVVAQPSLSDVLAADQWARQEVLACTQTVNS